MSDSWLIPDETSTKMLVAIFNNLDSPESKRDQAFIYITYRFRSQVLRHCEIICNKYKYDVSTAEMIADKTFESFARKGAFDETKGRGRNYDESLLIYLLAIAENELINYYREIQRRSKSPYNGSESIVYDLHSISQGVLKKLSVESRIEYEVISSLPQIKRAIYLTYAVHQRPGFKMPRKLLEELRSVFDVKQNTINAYLKEVRDSIKMALNSYRVTQNIEQDEQE